MGLLNLLKGVVYAPALVADNAVTQYHKMKRNQPEYSPKEIAGILWSWRYMNAFLTTEKTKRFLSYMETEFPIETMMDFCLSSLDIEIRVSPSDITVKSYNRAAHYIGKELIKNNVPFESGDIDLFTHKWNCFLSPLR